MSKSSSEDRDKNIATAINEIQLILAEKRTSLAIMRTGIAVLALPLSIMGFLIATSKYYNFLNVLPLLIPLTIINIFLIILGCYLIIRSIIRIRRYDYFINQIKKEYSIIEKLVD